MIGFIKNSLVDFSINKKTSAIQKFTIIIGSYARGDANSNSDIDICRIGHNKAFDISKTILKDNKLNPSYISYVDYSEEDFVKLYNQGSLFLYHALNEGILVNGDSFCWNNYVKNFKVQTDFRPNISRIKETIDFMSNVEMYGGKFLYAYANLFVALKNMCIFLLAHNKQYEFNKEKCFEIAMPELLKQESNIKELINFYNIVARGLDMQFPFSPNEKNTAEAIFSLSKLTSQEVFNACCC